MSSVPSGPSAEDERPTSLRELAVERLTYFRSRVEPTEDRNTYGDGYRAGLAQLFAALDGHLRDADARLAALASRAPAGEPTSETPEHICGAAGGRSLYDPMCPACVAAMQARVAKEGAVRAEQERAILKSGNDLYWTGAAPDGTAPSEDDFTDAWYTEAMNLVSRIDPLAYKGGASLVERLRYIAAGAAPDGRAPSEGLRGVREMLEGLLAQTEAEMASADSERSKSFQTGAKVALLAALNYEPIRRAGDRRTP